MEIMQISQIDNDDTILKEDKILVFGEAPTWEVVQQISISWKEAEWNIILMKEIHRE